MPRVELKNVAKVFPLPDGQELWAVNDVSFEIPAGALTVLVGPSGSGKTTLLRLIAGLEGPSAGEIRIGGNRIDTLPPQDRDVAMVFQSHALYPHLTAAENIAIGLRLRHVRRAERDQRVAAVAEMLGLKKLLDRLPRQISGGERQRVALARAVVRRPAAFLLDEPLSSLDAPVRRQLRGEIARVQRESGAPMLYVTHDQAEAMALGDRVVVLREGLVQQIADPITIYDAPANAFVAGFIGSPPWNLLRGHFKTGPEGSFFLEHNVAGAVAGTRLALSLPADRAERLARVADGNAIAGVRPEDLHIGADGPGTFYATVESVEPLGPNSLVHVTTGANRLVVRADPEITNKPGEKIPLQADASKALFFNPVSEKLMV